MFLFTVIAASLAYVSADSLIELQKTQLRILIMKWYGTMSFLRKFEHDTIDSLRPNIL